MHLCRGVVDAGVCRYASRRARLEGGGGVSHQQTHGRQWESRPPITSYPPTCGQARRWGMKYGATGSAARDKRRAARVRGQKAGRQGQHLPPHSRRPLVFSTSAGDLKFKFRSRCALIWHEKVQKLQKCVHLPSEPAFSQEKTTARGWSLASERLFGLLSG